MPLHCQRVELQFGSLFHWGPLSTHPILILWQCLVTFLYVVYEGQAMFRHNHAKDPEQE